MEALRSDGNKLFKDGNFTGAIKKYKEAILLRPSAALFTNRAACHVMLNRLRDAIEDCDRALALDKSWIRAYIRKAETQLRLKEPHAAVITLTKGLTLIPDNEEMRNLLCKVNADIFQEARTFDVRYTHIHSGTLMHAKLSATNLCICIRSLASALIAA